MSVTAIVVTISMAVLFVLNGTMVLTSCQKTAASPDPYPDNQITKAQANTLLHQKSTAKYNYYKVSHKQLRAMLIIADQHPDVVAFKIYPAGDQSIIIGQDSTGQQFDIPIFITGIENTGICPDICDER